MDLNFSIDYKFTHDSFIYEFIPIYTPVQEFGNLLANLFAICNSIILLATEF